MGDYSGVEELPIIEKYLKNYNHDLVLKLSEFLKNKETKRKCNKNPTIKEERKNEENEKRKSKRERSFN